MNRKSKIISPSPGSKSTADWSKLWSGMRMMYEVAGMDRHKSMLDNFKDQKEEICRVFNVVSEADLARMQRQIEHMKQKGM